MRNTRKPDGQPKLVLHGSRWHAYVPTPTGTRRISLRTPDYCEALRRLATWLERGAFEDEVYINNVSGVLSLYEVEVMPRLTTYREAANIIQRARDWLGTRPIPIDGTLCQRAVTGYLHEYCQRRLNENIAPSTVKKEARLLLSAFRYAVKRGEIPQVALCLPQLEGPQRQPHVLTPEQVARLFQEAAQMRLLGEDDPGPSRTLRFLMMAYWTGARRASIEQLRWEHIDLDAGVVDFRPYYAGTRRKRGAKVPMSRILWDFVKKCKEYARTPFYLGRPHDMFYPMKKLFEKCGLDGCVSHDLRHTRATMLIAAGATAEQAAALLGNSPSTVKAVYNHLPHKVEELRQLIDQFDN